jgi:hypothetical protein
LGFLLKFIGAALFGGLVSFAVLFVAFVVLDVDIMFSANGKWFHCLWMIPLAWGILGIFCFDRMLALARAIFEGVLRRH